MTERKYTILAVDDERDMLETFESILNDKYNLITSSSAKTALKKIREENIDLALLDLRMPKTNGIELLKKLRSINPDLDSIIISALKDVPSAVEAMKLGAFDYVTKPFEVKGLMALIEKALGKKELMRENLYLRESLKETTQYYDLIGKTDQMQGIFKTIDYVAPTNSTILISGESGTGKELVARAIHQKSKRAQKPFITINCAAIPDNLFESELFGYEQGAFTGALERKMGKFELANGGTLFFDEIGCMSSPMQAKLLRVLEDQIIERVGGERGIKVDARIISATNINFKKHLEEEKFRHDLFYRLNVIPITLPPLRERKEDLVLFVKYFLNKYNKILNKKVKALNHDAQKLLYLYNWPGNVRELQNLIERVVVLAQNEIITKEQLPIKIPSPSSNIKNNANLKEAIINCEKEIINDILDKNQGNISQAARTLNIARTTLITKMKMLGIA